MRGDVLDIVVVLAAAAFAVSGFRQGFVVGLLSFVGFFGGALLGLQVAPPLVDGVAAGPGRVVLALVVVFGIAMIGQAIAVVLGGRIRDRFTWRSARVLDSIGGALISVGAVLLVAWMVAAPLASSSSPWLASQVRRSVVVAGVDSVMPGSVGTLYGSLASTLDAGDFPEVFGRFTPTDVPEVEPPDPELAGSAAVTRAAASTVKVVGDAPACDRRLAGSGFVYADGKVMTNAHVVAGVTEVQVELGEEVVDAVVVVYDPRRDLAVLDVPGLDAPALPFADGPAAAGADAVVVGYPLDGPYRPTEARVRDRRDVLGPDIYNESTVTREVYTLRAEVRSGNSGGPLLSADGAVYGVIFAAAKDDPDTGFAVTAREAEPVARAGLSAEAEVGTGPCD